MVWIVTVVFQQDDTNLTLLLQQPPCEHTAQPFPHIPGQAEASWASPGCGSGNSPVGNFGLMLQFHTVCAFFFFFLNSHDYGELLDKESFWVSPEVLFFKSKFPAPVIVLANGRNAVQTFEVSQEQINHPVLHHFTRTTAS